MTRPIRLGFIGDIHANLPALEAVLADADAWGAEAIHDIGDLLGYGPFPNEVVALLRRRGVDSILGNYDKKVLKFGRKRGSYRKKKHPLKFRSFEWTDSVLSTDARDYVASLSEDRRFVACRRAVLLVHARPGSDKKGLMPDAPEGKLKKIAERADADVIVCGHTHVPFVRHAGGVLFINTGSVGRCAGGIAQYARCILGQEMEAEIVTVRYDLERLLSAVRASGLPDEFVEYFRTGRDLAETDVTQ